MQLSPLMSHTCHSVSKTQRGVGSSEDTHVTEHSEQLCDCRGCRLVMYQLMTLSDQLILMTDHWTHPRVSDLLPASLLLAASQLSSEQLLSE